MNQTKAHPELVALPGGHQLLALADKAGTGVPVVFLNSLAADMSMWSDVHANLPSRPSLRFDARGHGGSNLVPGDCEVADLGRDALAMMDAHNIERAVLCGLSLGGIIVIWMAENAPDRVAGLALANTAITFPPSQMWRDRAATARTAGVDSLVDPTLQRWLTDGFRMTYPDKAAAVRAMISATPAEGYAASCAALAKADLSDALSAVKVPVLLVAGEHDQSTPVARLQEMQALCPAAEMIVLEAAHLSTVEAADAFASHLSAFLARVDQEEAPNG